MKTSKYWLAVIMGAMCLTGVWAERSFGALTDKQQSLAEIKTLYVFVQGLTDETQKAGLELKQIEADVKDKLKQMGIRVVSEEQGHRAPGNPSFYVNISAHKRKQSRAFVFHVNIGILQKVSLVREPGMRIMSITWTKGRLGYCTARAFVETIRGAVGYLMERFSEDYRAANPRAKGGKKSS
ncbi:MAG: hypothetical protein ACYS0C_05750 [Planctomycetota bacterium]|jgi:hypothetical protein